MESGWIALLVILGILSGVGHCFGSYKLCQRRNNSNETDSTFVSPTNNLSYNNDYSLI